MNYNIKNVLIAAVMSLLMATRCSQPKDNIPMDFSEKSILRRSTEKVQRLLQVSLDSNKIPRSEYNSQIVWSTKYTPEGELKFDWTLGFFPGTCWYLYEYTGDTKWSDAAIKLQSQFELLRKTTESHDMGFVFYNSYGNGYRLLADKHFKEVLIDAGNSLITRFNVKVGCLKSWDVDSGWQSERGWKFPVIVDNLMNLELLFELTELTGDTKYSDVAVKHANTTLRHHFREDHSSYHVVDYDPSTGEVRKKETAQGYSNESAWARGQAWALYGYVVCYRYTRDKRYLNQAIKIADFIKGHPNLPEDGIPYWDFNAPGIPDDPRDVSAAAIIASALAELNDYTDDKYADFADNLISSLSSKKYTKGMKENTGYILDHSVGSIPHGAEIDKPLVYADYYYIEALVRRVKKLK